MYRAHPYKLARYINTTGDTAGSAGGYGVDITPYPVELKSSVVNKYPTTTVVLTKLSCVSKRDAVSTTRSLTPDGPKR